MQQIASLLLTAPDHTDLNQGWPIDLSQKVMVFPGRRASRRFREILVSQAETLNKSFIPPSIVTVGNLPEQLMTKRSTYASDPVRLMLWAQAIEELPSDLRCRIDPGHPDQISTSASMALAKEVDSLFSELAAARLTFDDVSKKILSSDQIFPDSRWDALAQTLHLYQEKLAKNSLLDKHLYREEALIHGQIREIGEICLVATVDLNGVTRAFLKAYPGPVTPFIFSPESNRSLFCSLGCLIEDKWIEQHIDIPDSSITLLERRSDEVAHLSHLIARYQSELTSSDFTVGLADESQVGSIKSELERVGLDLHPPAGKSIQQTQPFRILQGVLDFLKTQSFRNLGTLIRNRDFALSLRHQVEFKETEIDPIAILDHYQFLHLQDQADRSYPDDFKYGESAKLIIAVVQRLLAPLQAKTTSLAEAISGITQFFSQIYQPLDELLLPEELSERQEVFAAIKKEFEEILAVEIQLTSLGIKEVARFLLQSLSTSSLPAIYNQSAIESLGWLELPLDDAQCTIVTGCQNKYLPQTINSHRFLPDRLRAQMGLRTNDSRLARDAYVLTVLINSKKILHLLLSKANNEGELLSPSRLFFQCEQEEILKRSKRFFSSANTGLRVEISSESFAKKNDQFTPTNPNPVSKPDKLTISSLKDYLRCPYRYYLKHVLNLKNIHDRKGELDALQFGTLTHEILAKLGKSKIVNEPDEALLTKFLLHELDTLFNAHYGDNTAVAGLVQKEILSSKLIQFAKNQVEWLKAGWRVEHIELALPDFKLELDSTEILLKARVDRIDYHSKRKQWAIIDYKTGEKPRNPRSCFNTRTEQWNDLQLPLYSYILGQNGFSGEIETAFWNLGLGSSKQEILTTTWNSDQLESALIEAKRVSFQISNSVFWPPATLRFKDEFSDLLASSVGDYDDQEEQTA